MIDSHAHIDAQQFDSDRLDMLERVRASGVELVIVPDIAPPRREKLKEIVDSLPYLFRGVGIHPHHAGEVTEQDLLDVEAQCTEEKVVAIGEIGLDYYYDFCSPEVQKLYFREQIRIAKRNNLPVIVHNRESDADVLDILEDEQDGSLRGVLHCFSSGVDVLERALSLGLMVSFTGNITFKASTLNSAVLRVPPDRVMIETDSPYMTPVPHRGTRNEPTHVRLVAEKIAEIKGMTFSEIAEITTANAKKFFGLLCALVVVSTMAVAQPRVPNEDDYDTDLKYEVALEAYEVDSMNWARYIKPRTFGFGLTIGSNTVVEQQTYSQRYYRAVQGTTTPQRWETYDPEQASTPSRSFTYDGLLSFGATLMFQASDRILLEATWMNTKNTGDRALYGLQPIVTNVYEASFNYSLNPYNKVNFVPQVGFLMANQDDGKVSLTNFGVNAGMGIGVNIPTSFGHFYPMVNVRFNFMFGVNKDQIIGKYPVIPGEDETYIVADPDQPGVFLHYNPADPSQLSMDKANVTTIYSIPRLSIMFFPKF